MKKLSNTETKLKKRVAYKKSVNMSSYNTLISYLFVAISKFN